MSDSILIIENNHSLQGALVSVLSRANFEVAAVSNYNEAVFKIATFKPDIAIIDEVLPDINGMEACYKLHINLNIPVVIVGEDYGDEVWEKVTEAYADCYLIKPFSFLVLVARIKAILRRYKIVFNSRSQYE